MSPIVQLVLNDLRRDAKRPWSLVLFVSLPLVLSLLIASVFGGAKGGPMPTVQVAVLDQDKDLLARVLRSLPTQGEAAQHLRLQFVPTREEGLRLVEKDKVSALVVLPAEMTGRLLKGQTNAIELYENPAQQIMPRVVREGVSLLALGLSAAAETLGEPLRKMRDLLQKDDFPAETAVADMASQSVKELKNFRSYAFPPLIKFTTVRAEDFTPYSTNAPVSRATP